MSNKKSLLFTLLFLSSLFLSGCVDNKTAPSSDVIPHDVAVSITPSATTLPTGGEQIFQASVTGSGNKAVTWSAQEGAPGGTFVNTISTGTGGVYTAPDTGGTFHVVATSQVDTTKTATATVTVSSTLDASFGAKGKVSTPFGGMDTINALVTQSDGKIVVGGSSLNGMEADFALARYESDGSLDASFGTGGIVVTSLGGSSEIKALVMQSDGRIVVGGSSNSDFALARYKTDGSLDTTFGSGPSGIVITNVGQGNDVFNALAIQSNGKIVAGGFSFVVPTGKLFSQGFNQFSLARFLSNGTIDTGFGTKGVVVSPFGSNVVGEIRALAIQSDGKIVAGGFSSQGGNDFALARYNTDGSLDTGFGGSGIVATPIGSGDDQIHALIISGGTIFAGGHAFIVSNNDFALARYGSTGALMSKLTTPIGTGTDEIKALAIQSDGKIVAGGFSSNGVNNDFALARYDAATGALVGTSTTPIGTGNSEIKAIAIQSNKIIVGGFSSKGMRQDFALAQYDNTGNLDTVFFGTSGIQTTPVGGGSDEVNALAIQSDGKIVVAGFSFGVNGIKNNEFSLARYGSDGALDTSFDADGKATTPIGSGDDEISALAIQSDGQIVVAGTAFNGTKDDFALARYNASNGGLDTSFDADGKVTTSIGTEDDEVNALILQADGKIVVAGTAFTGKNRNFALARYNTNGGLDTSFDADGKVTTEIGAGSSFARAMAIQTDGMIVVVGISSVLNATSGESDFDVTLVRYLTNGSPDPGFGTNGIVTTPIGNEQDMASAVVLQADGRIIVAGTAFTGSGVEDFVLLRYNIDGTPDTSFGVGGKTMTPIGTLANAPLAVKIQTNGKIVVGGYTSSVLNGRDFALVRFNANGTLDTGFGVEGIEISPFSAGVDEIHDIEILSNGKILAVGMSTNGNGENTDFHLAQYAPAP